MVHSQYTPAILSFCPGLRGLERGFERAVGRARVVAYVEIEAFIACNLVAEMEQGKLDAAPVWSDIKTFNADCVRGKFDWLLAGYPCQPFSNAGNRLGTDDPRHLFPYILRTIETGRPMGCFFENVEGHLTLGYDTVYQSLRALGYAVEEGIYSAEEAGAPHQRNRLFILAIREDVELGNPQYDGYFTKPQLRSNEAPSAEWRQKEQDEARQHAGAIGRYDAASLQRCENGEQPGITGEDELADTNGIRHLHGQPQQHPTETGEHAQRELAASGQTELGNTYSGQLQGTQPTWLRQFSKKDRTRMDDRSKQSSYDRWPARPGQEQYDWEAPRTVEPGLGCTIDGYNYREDLLRAYGNSVVEQTAEIAFKDLLQKHIDNHAKNM